MCGAVCPLFTSCWTRRPLSPSKSVRSSGELRQLCAELPGAYVQPVGYKFIDSMPMTPVGKFDYRKLEEEITSRDY